MTITMQDWADARRRRIRSERIRKRRRILFWRVVAGELVFWAGLILSVMVMGRGVVRCAGGDWFGAAEVAAGLLALWEGCAIAMRIWEGRGIW